MSEALPGRGRWRLFGLVGRTNARRPGKNIDTGLQEKQSARPISELTTFAMAAEPIQQAVDILIISCHYPTMRMIRR